MKRKAGNIFRAKTLQECADELGCTAERVRQIEARALYKLRAVLAQRGVTPEFILPANFEEARA